MTREKTSGYPSEAHLPVGHKGSELKINIHNGSQIINGIKYSGHSLDRMQGRGLVPSVIKDAITNPIKVYKGNTSNTVVYESSNVKVVVNSEGTIVTVYPK